MPRTASSSPNTRASGGSTCRSRRSRTSSRRRSSRPRTRISTSTPASMSTGIARAVAVNLRNSGSGERPRRRLDDHAAGGEELPAHERAARYERKIKEALLALRIEQAYSKDKIFELYLNEIYLGLGSYGIAAAALNYFDKSVNELTIARGRLSRGAAEGAGELQSVPLPRSRGRAPQLGDRPHGRERLHPRRRRRGREGGEARGVDPAARQLPLRRRVLRRGGPPQPHRACTASEKLYEGGLSVRTTLDPKLQSLARAEAAGRADQVRPGARLSRAGHDDRHRRRLGRGARRGGRRSPMCRNGGSPSSCDGRGDAALHRPAAADAWRSGALAPERENGTIPLAEMKWAKSGDAVSARC